MRTTLAWVLVVAALIPTCVRGQQVSVVGAAQSYTMGNAREVHLHDVVLRSMSFGAIVPLSGWARASVETGWASASMTLPNGERAEVDGIVDSQVALELRLRGGLTLIGSGIIPTGEVARDLDAARVVGLLSADLFPFAINQWGSGGGLGADVSYSTRSDDMAVDVSAGALFLSESSPFAPHPLAYQPGNQIRARGMLEVAAGDASVVSVLVGVQRFAPDRNLSESLFRPGLRIESVLSMGFPVGSRESALVYGRFYRLGESDVALAPGDVYPGGRDQPSRHVFAAGGEMRIARDIAELAPHGEMRVLRRGDGRGQGWLASVGIRTALRVAGGQLGRQAVVEPRVALRVGRLVAGNDASSGVMGWEAGVSLRWARGR